MQTIAERLLDAKRQLEKACARFDDEVEKIARVAAVIENVAYAPSTPGATAAIPPPRRAPTAETQALREAARAGALSLAMTWNADGSAAVRVNGGTPFHVQAKPAALLRIIAAAGGRDAADGLIGWRPPAEVAQALGKATRGVTTRRNLTHTLYKLRRAFRDAGQNWFFIQTDGSGSIRFALRVAAAESAAHDHGAVRW